MTENGPDPQKTADLPIGGLPAELTDHIPFDLKHLVVFNRFFVDIRELEQIDTFAQAHHDFQMGRREFVHRFPGFGKGVQIDFQQVHDQLRTAVYHFAVDDIDPVDLEGQFFTPTRFVFLQYFFIQYNGGVMDIEVYGFDL
jgi:hypothetical protein